MQRVSKSWYQGTADAVFQNIYSIGSEEPKHVLILSGDHIYKMNYALMKQQHCESGADVTIATLPITPDKVSEFGVVQVSKNGEVTGFVEKPKETDIRSPFDPDMVDVSMGIYLFNTDVLLPELVRDSEDPDSKHDFGHDILPKLLGRYKVKAYNFVDENKQRALYWRDVGTLEAYYEANMDIAAVAPTFNLYDKAWPMRSRAYQYPLRPSSSSASPAAPVWPSTPSSAPAPLSRARSSATPCSRTTCASTATPTWTPASSSPTSTSAATAASATP